jgi:NAD/NADP transhydrogenase alpha subunit
MDSVFGRYTPLDIQYVAVVTAFVAFTALFPLNCTAASKGKAAE